MLKGGGVHKAAAGSKAEIPTFPSEYRFHPKSRREIARAGVGPIARFDPKLPSPYLGKLQFIEILCGAWPLRAFTWVNLRASLG
jgi:hypothetical protein